MTKMLFLYAFLKVQQFFFNQSDRVMHINVIKLGLIGLGNGGNKRMALFPGPSICISSDADYLKRYFHDNVLHLKWWSILYFNAMYKYHNPDEINLGGSGDIFVRGISFMSNTSQFSSMLTCPVWEPRSGDQLRNF